MQDNKDIKALKTSVEAEAQLAIVMYPEGPQYAAEQPSGVKEVGAGTLTPQFCH